MGVYPKGYTKEEFVNFLEKNNVEDSVIKKFLSLPEKINAKGSKFKLYISSTFVSVGNTYYNFELNYYSEDKIEFLFPYKLFKNIEKSIDNLLCDLVAGKYISSSK